MALSDYLTGQEWDACFYAFIGQHAAEDLGGSMRKTINHLLGLGYRFPGLNDDGSKKVQVENGINAPKVCIFLGNPHGCDILGILDSGREFWKRHDPTMVDETDDEWAEQMQDAKAKAKGGAA